VWEGVPPDVRSMAYRVAIGTGFRADEIRSLTPESFDLVVRPPTITVQAAYSKRRRRDEQPIRTDMAELLKAWLKDRPAGVPVFPIHARAADMMRHDLANARAAWVESLPEQQREAAERSDFLRDVDAAKRVVDFHALRHTYCTMLGRSGLPPKAMQVLARHSTAALTVGRYGHLHSTDISVGLDALPSVQVKEAVVMMTGNGHAVSGTVCENVKYDAAGECRAIPLCAASTTHAPKRRTNASGSKRKGNASVGRAIPLCAPSDENASGWIRTNDLRFRKPQDNSRTDDSISTCASDTPDCARKCEVDLAERIARHGQALLRLPQQIREAILRMTECQT
jgi:hypothetical protein